WGHGDGYPYHLAIFRSPRFSDSCLCFRACGLPYFSLPQSWSGRTGHRRSLSSQTESGTLLPSPSADGSLADGAADSRTRLALLFRADAAGAARQPGGCAVCTATGVVLPAHISMAEILAWVGCGDRRACHSNAPCPGDPCAPVFGSQCRTTSVEAAGCNGSLRLRGVHAAGPRSTQPVCGSTRLRSGPATDQAEGRRGRI